MFVDSFHSAASDETKERTKYNKYIKTIMIIITPIIIINSISRKRKSN